MTHDKTILVLGATGRQGGATVRHLLANGWCVRLLVRDPSKPAVAELREAGAEVFQGDFDDTASLNAAMQGVYGVFSVQASVDEVRQGKQIADSALAAGVQHFIFASVQSADDLARVGGDSNKWEIEQYIRTLDLPATIIRPCLFMDDLLGERYGVPGGVFTIAFKPDVQVGLIAAYDIGGFVALAFDQPETYIGQTVELGGDAITPPEIAALISRALGRDIPYVQIPVETTAAQNTQIARAFEFLNEVGYTADIPTLRRVYPALMTLESWLTTEGAPILNAY